MYKIKNKEKYALTENNSHERKEKPLEKEQAEEEERRSGSNETA